MFVAGDPLPSRRQAGQFPGVDRSSAAPANSPAKNGAKRAIHTIGSRKFTDTASEKREGKELTLNACAGVPALAGLSSTQGLTGNQTDRNLISERTDSKPGGSGESTGCRRGRPRRFSHRSRPRRNAKKRRGERRYDQRVKHRAASHCRPCLQCATLIERARFNLRASLCRSASDSFTSVARGVRRP